MNEIEQWKPVRFFEEYEVSNLGNIRNTNYRREHRLQNLKPYINNKVYMVTLCANGVTYKRSVKYIVADAFMDYVGKGYVLYNINGNARDNRVSNLEFREKPNNVKKKRIVQSDLDGNNTRVWDSIKSAAESLKIPYEKVRRCCVGKSNNVNGFVFRFY